MQQYVALVKILILSIGLIRRCFMLKCRAVYRKNPLDCLAETEYEFCVLCRKQTDVERNMPIDLRTCYVEGAGQLCLSCWKQLNDIDPE